MQTSNVISKSCSFFDEMLTWIGGGGGVGGGDNVAVWSVCRTQNRVVPFWPLAGFVSRSPRVQIIGRTCKSPDSKTD